MFTPTHSLPYPAHIPAGRWGGVSYKGDWLTRPIASNEVGLLVRVLVAMSQRVNRLLGLDQPWKVGGG